MTDHPDARELYTRHSGVVSASNWVTRSIDREGFPVIHKRAIPPGFRQYRKAELSQIPEPWCAKARWLIVHHPRTRFIIAPERGAR